MVPYLHYNFQVGTCLPTCTWYVCRLYRPVLTRLTPHAIYIHCYHYQHHGSFIHYQPSALLFPELTYSIPTWHVHTPQVTDSLTSCNQQCKGSLHRLEHALTWFRRRLGATAPGNRTRVRQSGRPTAVLSRIYFLFTCIRVGDC